MSHREEDYAFVGKIAYQQSVEKTKLPEPGRAPDVPPEFEKTEQQLWYQLQLLLFDAFGKVPVFAMRGTGFDEDFRHLLSCVYLNGYKEGVRQAEKASSEAAWAETQANMRGIFSALLNKNEE